MKKEKRGKTNSQSKRKQGNENMHGKGGKLDEKRKRERGRKTR